MRRFITSFIAGLFTLLAGYCISSAADVPGALSAEGPALARFDNLTVTAWAGLAGVADHAVHYSTIGGNSTAVMTISGALTITAPGLASTTQSLYLATTPPDADNSIALYASSDAATFNEIGPLCDATECARTLAAPALVGQGAILHAAWSTPNGAIRYATYINGVWSIAADAIPNAQTKPATGPALAIYQNRLYVAWLSANGLSVSVTSRALPLSTGSWSAPIQITASSSVAPALGVLIVPSAGPNPVLTQALFLASTATDFTIHFARFNPQVGQWGTAPSPISLPTGPLTAEAVALNSFTQEQSQECVSTDALILTRKEPTQKQHQINVFEKVTGGCP